MTPLRDKFEKARNAYESTRYPGDLADAVLGATPKSTPKSTSATRSVGARVFVIPRRTEVMRWSFAAAAAIALSCGAYFLGTRTTRPTDTIAKTSMQPPTNVVPTPVVPNDVLPTDPTQIATQTHTAIDETTDEATDEATQDFTIVPTLSSLSQDTGTDSGVMNLTFSVPESPMLFSLGTLSEQQPEETTNSSENKS